MASTTFSKSPPWYKSRWAAIGITCLVICLAFVVGLLIGAYIIGDDDDDSESCIGPETPERLLSDGDEAIVQKLMDALDRDKIEANLKVLTSQAHIAGSQGDYDTVAFVQAQFEAAGLTVQTTPYDVLLSTPDVTSPDSVKLLDSANNVIYDSRDDESDISHLEGVIPPFLAYSPSALVEGPLVYAGLGRVEDFELLKDRGVTVSGHIAIIRYGINFRGDKVDNAARNGAIGVILFTDPDDVTTINRGDPRVLPETWWLPQDGAQRGTIALTTGDPLTLGRPANNIAYRINETEAALPSIPAHPIGYGAAYNIMKHMTGMDAPNNTLWQGGMNFTYKIGPGFSTAGLKIQLNVTTQNQRKVVHNVFGTIKGALESDRYVLFGNHRDAWIYGAIDPSIGTAVMLEMARVMGQMVKEGTWRPRRTIMFCSWGAEEYGLIGSTEWVEEYVATLRERSVAYLNLDLAVEGNDTLKAASTPILYNTLWNAAKKVPTPKASEVAAGRTTMYDTWLHYQPWPDTTDLPAIYSLGSWSDFAPLLQISGIPSLDMRYSWDQRKYGLSPLLLYPTYHTEHETYEVYKTQFDRNFTCALAMAQLGTEMIRSLADSLLLPFNLTSYVMGLEMNRKLLDNKHGALLTQHLHNYGDLISVIGNFSKDVEAFQERLVALDTNNPFVYREVNDQMMLLDRVFLDPEGLPSRPDKKHLLWAESATDLYSPTSFPGIDDLLFEIEDEPARWDLVKQHFAIILQAIQSAGVSLRDVTRFMSETL